MAGHDIIVIGGSAGGIEALSSVLATLPPGLPAAMCVAIHQGSGAPNRRPQILSRAGPLPVVLGEQGMRVCAATIYLAVPDQHLLIERAARAPLGVLRLLHGPPENHSRPAIDPLFRSAALAFGPRVIGVVLSGALHDGTDGLSHIRERGGLAVVQEPSDALVSSMPMYAIDTVGADHVIPASAMGALLAELTRAPSGRRPASRTKRPSHRARH
jgi:two-component system chemotaxis response regulator CheB